MSPFTERLNEMLIPGTEDLLPYPEMAQPLIDQLNRLISGWPMMVTQMPTSDGRILLRIETQEPGNPKNRIINYVWPRNNL